MQTLVEMLADWPSLEYLAGMAQQGVPRGFVNDLAEALCLPVNNLAPLIHISPRTLRRYQPVQALPFEASERALLVARILMRAITVLESQQKAVHWLTTRNGALGAAPIEHMDTVFGIERVEQILMCIEHGVYS